MQNLFKRTKLTLVSALMVIGLIAAACGPAEDPATAPGTTAPGTTAPATTPADPAAPASDPAAPAAPAN